MKFGEGDLELLATDLKEAEGERRDSEKNLREILEGSPMGVAVVAHKRKNGCVEAKRLFVNDALVKLFGGTSPGEFADSDVPETWVDLDQLHAHNETLKNGGDLVDFEVRRRRIDGTELWVSMNSRPIRFDDQDCTIIWHSDITERKRVEEELRESKERYRELFDESPVAVWVEDWSPIKHMLDDIARRGVKDWRGYFTSHREQLKTAYDSAEAIEISLAVIELYGKESKDHLLERSTAAVVIDEELDAFLEIVLSFLAGRMTVDIEAKDTAGDGSEMIVRRRVVMPPKYRDDWSRVIYAIEDVSERARAEEQLRQAQKMEAVGQLTSGVAHDFNNLLAVIMGNAELLLGALQGKAAKQFDAVIKAAERGAELTHRLLAFSRKQTLQPRAVDLKALLGGMINLLDRTLGETIEIKTLSAQGLWWAEVDPGQLENALLNLVVNARDVMPEGGTLVIEASNANLDEASAHYHADLTPGDYVILAVSDSGSGMSPEVLERAFEPFFTTKEAGQGSGLGLAMVYGFAKQSGGHVTIYSEQGHGTTVKLYLPRMREEAAGAGDGTVTEVPRAKGETVLVVEDDADVRQLAVAMLEGLGYRVLQAPDGPAALVILDNCPPPELLLSDLVLPRGLSGPDVAEKVKRALPAIKVLFMSGYANHAARHRSLAMTDAELLNKPFSMRELALKVRGALDR